jgi:hypothetical protein
MKRSLSILFVTATLLSGCTIKYSFTGASISPEVKTFCVKMFPNMAPLVNPSLSASFTDALTMKMLTNTRLAQMSEEGDLTFEGEITSYAVTPQAVTAAELASQNRLTIGIHVKFTNIIDDTQNFDKTFSQYEDYDSQQSLNDVESQLIDMITEKLCEDIFNAAVANW